MSDASDIQSTAVDIAKKGLREIQAGDRRHQYSDPMKLHKLSKEKAAEALDDDYGGLINLKFVEPT